MKARDKKRKIKMTSTLKALGALLLLVLLTGAAVQPSMAQQGRPAPAPTKQAQTPPKAAAPAKSARNEPYGRWDQSWGARPPAPPRHWTKKSDWHRHVRACQQKYRSYDARTDTYRTYQGRTRRCPE